MANLTMGQFLSNPTGKYSSNVARRDRIKADLVARFRKLYRERRRGFSVAFFRFPKEKTITAHIKVPSEELNKSTLNYDVVLEFTYPPSAKDLPTSVNFTSLKYMPMKVYSNSPNFTFTYAYVFNQADLLVEWMKPRLSRQSLEEEPTKRNPDLSFGFEKSIYFAVLYLQEFSLRNTKLYMNTWKQRDLISLIPTANQKLKQNQATKIKMKKQGVKRQIIDRLNPFRSSPTSALVEAPTPEAAKQTLKTAKPAARKKTKLGATKRKPLVNKITRKKSTKR